MSKFEKHHFPTFKQASTFSPHHVHHPKTYFKHLWITIKHVVTFKHWNIKNTKLKVLNSHMQTLNWSTTRSKSKNLILAKLETLNLKEWWWWYSLILLSSPRLDDLQLFISTWNIYLSFTCKNEYEPWSLLSLISVLPMCSSPFI